MWTSFLVLITGYFVWFGCDVFRLLRFFVPLLPVLTALATLGAGSLWLSLGSRRAAAALGAVGATMVVLYARQLAQARQLSSASTRLCVVAKGVAGLPARPTAPRGRIAALGGGAPAVFGAKALLE